MLILSMICIMFILDSTLTKCSSNVPVLSLAYHHCRSLKNILAWLGDFGFKQILLYILFLSNFGNII